MNTISSHSSQPQQFEQGHPLTFKDFAKCAVTWLRRNPLAALLVATILATTAYFYTGINLFVNGSISAARWAWESWNAEGNMEHARIVPLISLGLVWYHREKIRSAPKAGSDFGLLLVGWGILMFVLSVRALQPRLALFALPFLILGSIWFLWGKHVARILMFPCAFLLFTINSAFVEQATFRLQFVITSIVGFLSQIIGISIQAVGTTLTANDGSFNFEIAEGCSGIRSLMAMTMLVAVYVHLTQDELWKKLVIFFCSLLFAVIGNIGRIFTVILVAKFYDPTIASGIYHDYSGYVFFPIAVGAMLGFSKLVNLDIGELLKPDSNHGAGITKDDSSTQREISYDY